MVKAATSEAPAPRAGLSALLDDVDDGPAAKAPVDRDTIKAVSEEVGFTGVPAKPKGARKAPVSPAPEVGQGADVSLGMAEDEVKRRVANRRPGHRTEGPKVQWNTRISEEHFAMIDVLREKTGIPYGKLAERAIELLARELDD